MRNTIVVIENDASILEVLTLIFDNQGFNVLSFNSEKGAVQTILDIQPCCVILDIVRVTEAGTLLCRKLKNDERSHHIPIVAISTQLNAHTLKGIWADEVLSKPFDINELNAAVKKQIINVAELAHYLAV